MNAFEVGKRLVELCRHGKYQEATDTLYSSDVVSQEPAPVPVDLVGAASFGLANAREVRGFEKAKEKVKWWADNHSVHSHEVEGPYPNGDQFIVRFKYDVTNKPSGVRMQMDEMGLYTVANGKIVRAEFFYQTRP
jgi:SnoaL-like domain